MKLTPEQRLSIIAEFNQGGVTKKELAEKYGVSRGTILYIVDEFAAERNRQAQRERMRRKRHGK